MYYVWYISIEIELNDSESLSELVVPFMGFNQSIYEFIF